MSDQRRYGFPHLLDKRKVVCAVARVRFVAARNRIDRAMVKIA